ETSTFTPFTTGARDFEDGFGVYRGDEVAGRFRGANIPTGGFLDAAGELGFDPVPLLWAFAYPAGLVEREAYESLRDELLGRLAGLARGELETATALVQLPLFWHMTRQTTGVPPWTEVVERLHELEARPHVVTATVATGFPFSDVPDRGASVIVVTAGDEDAAG